MTWGDDDVLYTAYGDGNGFEPFVLKKLSLGLAKVTGTPPNIRGVNLRSPSMESTGDGMHGHKASGILMVDGMLYLLVRNAGNARLAWSRDHGETWSWADWKLTESFGAPTFINFGRNYAAARDGFVYIVSHDSNSAYIPSDSFVLVRVPRERIRERAAWEFFAGVENGVVDWTREISQRRPILSSPGRCHRVGVTYNPGLQRYLLVNPVPVAASRDRAGKVDTRFIGGLAVYEAQEPWGPWKAVFNTDNWDVGPGETASFPTKWMSADGRTLHLVFSGDDYFSVRKATLLTHPSSATADGFTSLFDGRTLNGWQGATEDWAAVNGNLVYLARTRPKSSAALPTLKLMSDREYGDFVLRFEFKLAPGANNGVAIRAPLEGDAAFVGMEIQVIDNDGWRGKLKPFQVHGSIYGVVPAKTGHLKPAGEWNSEEIVCVGRRIKVTLNGSVIVDANLDEVSPIDGKAHPGLQRERGYIGFLGHTRRVEFRNIRINERPAGSMNPNHVGHANQR